jgi:MoxR-like ATPase
MQEELKSALERIHANVAHVIKDKDEIIRLLLTALVSDGHVLMEDVPGVGKTVLAKALAKSIQADFKRIQFTPDLLPADVTGSYIFNQRTNEFEFRHGPVFTNVLLADEINRATPRTQSSLLEAMEERQVTSDGVTIPLAAPFLVMATQNPIEQQGTFPLPEAQLDRFLMKLRVGYPGYQGEMAMIESQSVRHPLEDLQPVADVATVTALQRAARGLFVHGGIKRYVLEIVRATREREEVLVGASPRGTLALERAAQGYSLVHAREFVTPEAVKAVAPQVLAHRLILSPQARLKKVTAESVIAAILEATALPVEYAAGE